MMTIISPNFLMISIFPISLLLSAFAFSLHISYADADDDGLIEAHVTTGRTLLQTKTTCSEDFANKNYTIITSKCKGPNYPKEACCSAFKEFACPFAEVLNDKKTDCASTMFSYINLYGRYPPGIFSNMCKEDNHQGLDCTNVTTTTSTSSGNSLATTTSTSTPLFLSAFLLFLFFKLFNF